MWNKVDLAAIALNSKSLCAFSRLRDRETKSDRRALLALSIEERKILKQVLQLKEPS